MTDEATLTEEAEKAVVTISRQLSRMEPHMFVGVAMSLAVGAIKTLAHFEGRVEACKHARWLIKMMREFIDES